MISVVIVFVGISCMILLHEFGHFLMARFFGLRVEEFGFGLPPRIWGKKIGETSYSINWLPFGGFVKIFGEDGAEAMLIKSPVIKDGDSASRNHEKSFRNQPPHKRAIIIVAGVVMNFILGWVLLVLVFVSGTPRRVLISSVFENSPASLGGIKANDLILEVGGNKNPKVQNVIDFVNNNKGQEVVMKIKRGAEDLEFKVVPRINLPKGEGALGVSLVEIGNESMGFFESVVNSFKEAVKIVGAIFLSLFNLIVGIFKGAGAKGVVGPVGIFQVAVDTGRLGFVYLLQLIALISLNLTVLNVLPFPALDGGRLLFILIEKIKGSPISTRSESIINSIGFAFLLLLMVFITVRDVARFL